MYTYILNYDKNSKLKNPAYDDVYEWLEEQDSSYEELTESVYLFRSTKYSNDIAKELEDLFYTSDKVNLIYMREKRADGKYYPLQDSDKARIYNRKINN